MADPVAVICTKNEYVLAASNVTSGSLMVTNSEPEKYSWTYVMTGNAAPANTDFTNAATMDNQQPFGFTAAVDIYVQARGSAGAVSRWV